MNQYVALLRGINVGGRNLIKMTALKACFEAHGFRDVTTLIQSGNVLFDSVDSGQVRLVAQIEEMLAATFNYPASIVLRSRKQMRDIVARAPLGFGTQPASYRYDVIFLKEPLKASIAIRSILTRQGVDEAFAGTGVLYFSRLISKASQSQLSRIVSLPIYQHMTIRNWNTTTKLLRIMEGASRATPPAAAASGWPGASGARPAHRVANVAGGVQIGSPLPIARVRSKYRRAR
jgi:uncharacterized protein (DUF1697 family)